MPLLTIAIPTYNRNIILDKTLLQLLPQLTHECDLKISDNASDVPFMYATHLNRFNVGSNGNVLKLIEYCTTEFIWILGDDDLVEPDAVSTVLGNIHRQPTCSFWNFGGPIFHRHQAISGRGLSGLVGALDSWSNLLFLSTGIYRTSLLQKNLEVGYNYAYSRAPHIAMLLVGMKPITQWCLSSHRIIEQNGLSPDRWSCVGTALGFPALLELVKDPAVKHNLADKVLPGTSSKRYISSQLAMMAVVDPKEALFLYDTINARLRVFNRGFPWYYRLFVRYPRQGLKAMSTYHTIIKGKPMKSEYISWSY